MTILVILGYLALAGLRLADFFLLPNARTSERQHEYDVS